MGCGGCTGETAEPKVTAKTVKKGEKIIVLTSKAALKIKEFMTEEKKKNFGLRVMVVPGGCAGYQYSLDFEEKAKADDVVQEEHGVKIFVDPESAGLLIGTEIDFIENLHQTGFKINNPNASSSCGCGNSFG